MVSQPSSQTFLEEEKEVSDQCESSAKRIEVKEAEGVTKPFSTIAFFTDSSLFPQTFYGNR